MSNAPFINATQSAGATVQLNSPPYMKPEDVALAHAAQRITEEIVAATRQLVADMTKEAVSYALTKGVYSMTSATVWQTVSADVYNATNRLQYAIHQALAAGLADAFRLWAERQSAENDKYADSE